ncbi:MAG: hypothetical protein U0M60_20970 [Clostridia bacterium]|nr:hypothetical protein [Clostridia bacterium]
METKEKMTKAELKNYYNEEVDVFLHKDDEKYKDDVIVIHNGTAIKIPRGKHVKVKRKYALIIDQSLADVSAANEKAIALQNEAAEIRTAE